MHFGEGIQLMYSCRTFFHIQYVFFPNYDYFFPSQPSSMDLLLKMCTSIFESIFNPTSGGHGGRLVTLSPPTSEIGVRFPTQPQVKAGSCLPLVGSLP